MFNNNINGNENKIRIKQTQQKNKPNSIFLEIIIGIIIAVVGGIILYFITGKN